MAMEEDFTQETDVPGARPEVSRRLTPIGVRFVRNWRGREASFLTYQLSVCFLTFLAYALYHSSRKPFSVVKSLLVAGEDSDVDSGSQMALSPSGWAPFNDGGGTELLGYMDLAFLLSYAVGTFICGHLGDNLNLRYFLSIGMIAGGFGASLFGLAYWLDVHSIYYFYAAQVISGFLQSTGWPSVVAVMGKWYGKENRGSIMGCWNMHTSAGNSMGSLLATKLLGYGWGWSFVIPGLLLSLGGIPIFLFLLVDRSIVEASTDREEEAGLLQHPEPRHEPAPLDASLDEPQSFRAVQIGEACRRGLLIFGQFSKTWGIPRVFPFACSLFCSKLVAYSLSNWLPFYITQTEINGQYPSVEAAGWLSICFDTGGVFGGMLAGYLYDITGAGHGATVVSLFLVLAMPILVIYRICGSFSLRYHKFLLTIVGIFVNGPYALITTAISAELGAHPTLEGDSRTLATVTAIIDGTGSLGAAVGPFLTGLISEKKGWDHVGAFLIVSILCSGLLLLNSVIKEMNGDSEVARQQILSNVGNEAESCHARDDVVNDENAGDPVTEL